MADIVKPHHLRQQAAIKRPDYRDARWERAVKVFTINQESKYLIVTNVPALGVVKELLALFTVYGEIEEYKLLDEYPCEPFTDVYFLKYRHIDSARIAKRKLDNWYFFSRQLHVCYAPEYESVGETREKLVQRRAIVAQKSVSNAEPATGAHQQQLSVPHSSKQCLQQQLDQQHLLSLVPPPVLPHAVYAPPPSVPPHTLVNLTGTPYHVPPMNHLLRPSNCIIPLSSLPPPPLPPHVHGVQQLRPRMMPHFIPQPHSSGLPSSLSQSQLPLAPHHRSVIVKNPSPVPPRPPPLISDAQKSKTRPPPLLSDLPFTSPPPLLPSQSITNQPPVSSSVNTDNLEVQVLPTNGKTSGSRINGLSTKDRVRLHLEESGSVDVSSPPGAHSVIRKQRRKSSGETGSDDVVVLKTTMSNQGPAIMRGRHPPSTLPHPLSPSVNAKIGTIQQVSAVNDARKSLSSFSSGITDVASNDRVTSQLSTVATQREGDMENCSRSLHSAREGLRNIKQVPVLQVTAQPHSSVVNRVVYRNQQCSISGDGHVTVTGLSHDTRDDKRPHSGSSIDSTVSNIRSRMAEVFRTPPDVQLYLSNSKRRRI